MDITGNFYFDPKANAELDNATKSHFTYDTSDDILFACSLLVWADLHAVVFTVLSYCKYLLWRSLWHKRLWAFLGVYLNHVSAHECLSVTSKVMLYNMVILIAPKTRALVEKSTVSSTMNGSTIVN